MKKEKKKEEKKKEEKKKINFLCIHVWLISMESVELVLAVKWLEYLNRFIIGLNGILILNCNVTLQPRSKSTECSVTSVLSRTVTCDKLQPVTADQNDTVSWLITSLYIQVRL